MLWASLNLIDGETATLRWEGLGERYRGIEFRTKGTDGKVEGVQCKSGRDIDWSIGSLIREGVAGHIRQQLTEGGADQFVLILASQASDLRDLAQRASASEDASAFLSSLSKPLTISFSRLRAAWTLSGTQQDIETARQLLSRIRVVEHLTPEAIERDVERRCGDLFLGPTSATRAAIREVVGSHLGQEITADLLLSILKSDRYGVLPRDWGRLPERVAAVESLRKRFVSQLGRLLIRGELIHRAETEVVLKAVNDLQGSKVILLHGGAGNGKSGVLYLWWRGDPRVESIIARMAQSGLEKVEERGAFIAAVGMILKQLTCVLAEECVEGNAHQRKGVASALARLIDEKPEGRAAAERLLPFFDDPESAVAGAAANVFRDEDFLRSSQGPSIAMAFVESEQFRRDPDDLIFPLSEYAGDLLPYQPVLARIVERATGDMSGLNSDIRRGSFGFADRTSECLLRIYERAQASGYEMVRSWCLDQLDALVRGGDQFGEQALAKLDVDA